MRRAYPGTALSLQLILQRRQVRVVITLPLRYPATHGELSVRTAEAHALWPTKPPFSLGNLDSDALAGRPEKRSTSPISGTIIPVSAPSLAPKGSGRRTVLKHCAARALEMRVPLRTSSV